MHYSLDLCQIIRIILLSMLLYFSDIWFGDALNDLPPNAFIFFQHNRPIAHEDLSSPDSPTARAQLAVQLAPTAIFASNFDGLVLSCIPTASVNSSQLERSEIRSFLVRDQQVGSNVVVIQES